MNQLSHLELVPNEPRETFFIRQIDYLKNLLQEHPEDKLQIMPQILIFMQYVESDDTIIKYALDLLPLDLQKSE